jgi:2-C-methyl-D-erythritol 4-phosphate cytidylyltransferase/2-C-methyl-D-erythritol 2,4-cyclodiphosphate synthase
MSPKAAAIIPAAGFGSRMKLDQPKQYHLLCGTPILARTVRTFIASPVIDEIVVVVPAGRIEETSTMFDDYGIPCENLSIVAGGKRRQDSVYQGLQSCSEDVDIILVHDGARPLVDIDLINRCYEGATIHGAVIAALPVKDTLKKSNTEGKILSTIDRTDLFQAQTPQAARRSLLEKGYAENHGQDVTDEASLLEKAGIEITLVEGNETNLKITRPEDLPLAEKILSSSARPLIKIGHGYDAHRFAKNRELVLGGVSIEHTHGLAGHSDADVLTHALCDALLGALGAGDIGKHFPDSDDKYKGIYSIELLQEVMLFAGEKGFTLTNADITVVCQAPKLAPYLSQMTLLIAKACMTEPGCINIKATTTEQMGFTGREEGISCHAVVLVQADQENIPH